MNEELYAQKQVTYVQNLPSMSKNANMGNIAHDKNIHIETTKMQLQG